MRFIGPGAIIGAIAENTGISWLRMALNHTQLQAIKPTGKTEKYTDRDGLFLEVQPTGTKTWRYQYRLHGKREKLTIGRYPAISLAEARKLRDEAAALVARGESPAKKKQEGKRQKLIEAASATTFEQLAQRWIEDDVAHQSDKWLYTVKNWLKLDIYPAIGRLDPRTVTREHVQAIINKVVDRGSPASANQVLRICRKVFDYAVDREELEKNPAARIKKVNTPDASNHRSLAAKEIKPFLDALDAIGAKESNKLAIRMLMYTFTRKDELRLAMWSEFDLENATWDIPAHRMAKNGLAHRVYLSLQVVAILERLKVLSHGSDYVLPSNSTLSKPIGHTTLNSIIDRLNIQGGRFVPHGFRHTASTMLNELGFRADVIERQLAHKEQNKVRATYNKAEYAEERRAMMQAWADRIDALQQAAGANVVPIGAMKKVA